MAPTVPRLNYGPRMERFAMRPPELDAKINLLIGSVRSGKTWGLHTKIMYLCDYLVQGRRLLTGVSKASIKTNVLTDLFDLIGSRNYHYNVQSGELRLFNSDWLVYGAHDEGSEKYLRGATIGAAVCDEVVLMPQSYFQMLLTRMSPPGARVYGSSNADNSEHWLKKEYLDNEKLVQGGLLWYENYTMDDNPNLDPGYVADQKKLYTGVFYDRMILGRWNMVGGAVYSTVWGDWTLYDDKTRPSTLYNMGRRAQHYIGIDYGTTNPFAAVHVIDDGRTLWFDNEYYWDSKKQMKAKTDSEYAVDLLQFIKDSNIPAGMTPKIIIDPSAASFREELSRRGGLWLGQADNTVLDGIRRTASALKQQKIRVHKTRCPSTVREHVNYAWDKDAAKRGEEQPVKAGDHTCDAARYVVNDVFKNVYRLAA
jgi:PBSX family phage terminase large subunit